MMNKKLTTQPALFSVMVILFFIWGFITLLNDLLIPILKEKLHLTYSEAMLVQFWFFLTYFIMALPMVWILNRLRYKKSIVLGLLIIALGCFIFIPADSTLTYGLFLFAFAILASGIVMLQVSANPLVTLLGPPETGAARLTLAQGINSLGYVLAPLVATHLITTLPLHITYLIIAIIMLAVAIFIVTRNFKSVDSVQSAIVPIHTQADQRFLLWKDTAFLSGLIGIFVYVGAEVSTGSLVVSFLRLPQIVHFSIAQAGKYLSVYWGGAMIGRLVGSFVLAKLPSFKVLMFNAGANLLLLILLIFTTGYLAMWSLLLLGLFNSVMFPTLFALAIANLPSEYLKNKAAGFLIMAIVGGAIIPELQGALADQIGVQQSFCLLLICYAIIMICAFRIGRYQSRKV
jgi:FHS family L-fucose permease-like MFS transporter